MKTICYSLVLLLLLLLNFVSANDISGSEFTCDTTFYNSQPVATSVRDLKPTDIRVIGALGDSWTSGFRILTQAENLMTEFTDFRGLAWSIGGDASLSTVTTLPNIIREFTDDLYGYSVNTTLAVPNALPSLPNARFNLGFLNGHVYNLLGQAEEMVSRMRSDSNIDFENDWKVVTIFAGFNDLCDGCVNSPLGDPDVWISNYTTALDYLRDNLPRAFVNVVQLSDLLSLHDAVSGHPTFGSFCQAGLALICPCGRQGNNFIGEDEFRQLNNEYKSRLTELLSTTRYRREDFTVELQLFIDQFDLVAFSGEGQDVDLTLLASDCLHLSGRGNRLLATGLWNNMFQTGGEKQVTISDQDSIFCPTEEKAIFAVTPANISGSIFPCDLSMYDGVIPAKDIHELKPTDISVVGAMGDSLTSGFRVLTEQENLPTEFTDYRGLSWSIGGDLNLSTVTTLPNILRLYNSDLYGYSEDTTSVASYLELPNTRFNVGHLNGHASDLLPQATALVEKIRNDGNVDFDNDWKVVTVFVGLNDVCDGCINSPMREPDNWIADYQAALDYLHNNLPRTYVNVIQLLDLYSLMQTVSGHSTVGTFCQGGYRLICPCGPFGPNNIGETAFREINTQYKSKLEELVASGRYDTKNDFTVELQRFLEKFDLASFGEVGDDPDVTFLASDCLHLSGLGNRLLATALWNSMFQSSKDEPDTISGEETILCPTEERPIFATSKNLNTGGLGSASVLKSNILYVAILTCFTVLWYFL